MLGQFVTHMEKDEIKSIPHSICKNKVQMDQYKCEKTNKKHNINCFFKCKHKNKTRVNSCTA